MYVPAVVIGGGHAGLAMSRRLGERSIEHVVLERGRVANAWRTQRWDSLRLLTPNWHVGLPGAPASEHEPDGFMTALELAGLIERYGVWIDAPIIEGVTVTRLGVCGDDFEVVTDAGVWTCSAAVVATGGAARASVPTFATELPAGMASTTALGYRNPESLPYGRVLVVGASASGVQLAEEIHASGRPVTMSVGEHVRLPRSYRGRDIFWWTEAVGILGERYDAVDDLVRVRHLPSPQLIGSTDGRMIDLNALTDAGVGIVGRLGRIDDGVARFSGGLANVCALADLKLDRLLRTFDAAASGLGIGSGSGGPARFAPTRVPGAPATEVDLGREGFGAVVWATGCRPDHGWIDLPVFDRSGRIRHDGGAVRDVPGLYVLGLSALRRRRSSYVGGAALDTDELAGQIHQHLDACVSLRRPFTVDRPERRHRASTGRRPRTLSRRRTGRARRPAD
jgi:putative flavoprotein involved in K+ transport